MTSDDLVALSEVRGLTGSGGARAIRVASGLSLSEVARAVGVSTPTVYRWETGQRRPGGAAAVIYARVLRDLVRGSRRPL